MSLYKRFIKKNLKKFGETKFVLKLVSNIFYYYAKLVGHTTKWQTKGIEDFHKIAKQNGGVILVIWHGRAVMLPFFKQKNLPLDALVSPHRDGQMIAGLLKKFGIGVIDGSTNENAKAGALELMRTLNKDHSICIIPDGPRGPRMHMKKSPIFYAWKTGKPIIAASYSIKNAKIINKAWDKMMVPLPFSYGVCKTAEPLYVPSSANEKDLEKYRLELEERLNQITFECDIDLGRQPILPNNNSEKIKKHSKH